MDDKLELLRRAIALPTERQRSAAFCDFVSVVHEDIGLSIDRHRSWWLEDNECLPADAVQLVLLAAIVQFGRIVALEDQIARDKRDLGIREATLSPYVACLVQALVQEHSNAYAHLADERVPSNFDAPELAAKSLTLSFTQAPAPVFADSSREECPAVRHEDKTFVISQKSFDELVESLISRVRRKGFREEDAKDIVSDAIVKILTFQGNIDNVIGLLSHAAFSYVIPTTIRKLQRRRKEAASGSTDAGHQDDANSPVSNAMAQELLHLIVRFVASCEPLDRETLIASGCDQFHPQQIVEKISLRLRVLKTSKEASAQRIKSLRLLEEALAKHGYSAPPSKRKNEPQDPIG